MNTFSKAEATKNSGQSLVEMLIAISIISVSLLGILVLINRSIGLNKVTSESYTATYLAAEGIELVKNAFDHFFLEEFQNNPGSLNFYGWGNNIRQGVYVMDYNDLGLNPSSFCSFPGEANQPEVRRLLLTSSVPCVNELTLYADSSSGLFIHNASSEPKSKFRRVIIINKPSEFSGDSDVEYRVTSAVSWETRGGKFVVQLQDHFLPWRIP